jgi:hypothetical protein
MHNMNDTYNGWANYETWNVALYIQNEVSLYRLARSLKHRRNPYAEFRYLMTDEFGTTRTPDDVSYNDPSLDTDELNEMISEL